MGLSDVLPRTDLARRRRFEQRVYRLRWFALPFALTLVLVLHAPPLWLSLVALTSYALHNLTRRALIARASAAWLCWGGGSLLALDIAVVLVGLWPMVTDGARAMQVVLALLLIEATQRLRFESPPVFVASVLLLTATLCGYALWIAGYGEEWRDAVVWVALLVAVAALSLMAYHKQMLRPARIGHGMAVVVNRSDPEIEASPQPPLLEPETPLSPRQREVVRLLASRMSTREIADALSLSIETVRGHLKGIYRTLRTHDRNEAVRRAQERGDLS